jgi:ADP-heptose:LPS heptosyltransferase
VRAKTAVLRLGGMGEVVLAGRITAALAPVVFVTRRAWLTLAAALPGVVEARAAEDGLDLRDCGAVVDLQGSLRARWLLARAGGGPRRGLARADLRRRARVWFKLPAPAPLPARFAAAAGGPAAPAPWLTAPGPPAPPAAWGLVPGAAWATKRWPPEAWAALITQLPGTLRLFGGPEDDALLSVLAEAAPARVEIIVEAGFERTLPGLAACGVVIGGDTGLSHLARALGRPTLTLLGPTTAEDGLWADHAHTLGVDLPCRPCSRFGGPRCPVGDHACLRALEPGQVAAAAAALRAQP